jgi:hypothetical protein
MVVISSINRGWMFLNKEMNEHFHFVKVQILSTWNVECAFGGEREKKMYVHKENKCLLGEFF